MFPFFATCPFLGDLYNHFFFVCVCVPCCFVSFLPMPWQHFFFAQRCRKAVASLASGPLGRSPSFGPKRNAVALWSWTWRGFVLPVGKWVHGTPSLTTKPIQSRLPIRGKLMGTALGGFGYPPVHQLTCNPPLVHFKGPWSNPGPRNDWLHASGEEGALPCLGRS